MKYKILVPDANGVFTFTKEELEKFMEEIYDEGYNEGMKHTITTPVYPPNPITYPTITWSDKTAPAWYDTWMCNSTTTAVGDTNGK